MQQHDAERVSTAAETRSEQVPGLLPAVVVATLSGVGFWLFLTSAVTGELPRDAANATASELAVVDQRDAAAALATMDGSTEFLAQFKQQKNGCPHPLAWVSVARAPGQPAGTIRLRSGNYFSPIFTLSDVPARVAIPYPSPYETGHGTLVAMHDGGAAVIALSPPWQVTQGDGPARQVTWPIALRCKPSDG
jgi:hypothetical protein